MVVGIVDGTLIPLASRPPKHGEDYYSIKSYYGISTMIICDHNCKILHILAGFSSSCHNSRAFTYSKMWLSSQTYLQRTNIYLLILLILFQRFLFQPRIGQLKGHFQSLRGLQINIESKRDHARAVLWVQACAALHNLLLDETYMMSSGMNVGVQRWMILKRKCYKEFNQFQEGVVLYPKQRENILNKLF